MKDSFFGATVTSFGATLLALVLACNGGNDEAPTTDTTTTTGAETTTEVSTDVLVIAPFTLTDSGGQAISMTADGHLTMEERDRPGPLFEPDGTITMDGDPIATIAADGTLTASTGEQIAIIAEDGSTHVNEYDISWGADGTLMGGNPDGPGVTLSPADSPAKRAATAVVLMMTMARPEENARPVDAAPAPRRASEEDSVDAAP